ncbi:rod shape-determining protein RodA [Sediminitomix flava]|uniref:Cell wall polymerase n=1 Tax=Sediminitomix flava TaxID=379075 RepID=A0A315Z7W9_SEDFL|nr:rod shape-determining protein RodA [Sediminitomix flava]PWJ39290.1 rod shape determining protein RodA [Sediminitomix flava]
MRRRSSSIAQGIDWVSVLLYLILVILGWLNIYAAVYQPDAQQSIFDMGINSGRQLMWICGAGILIAAILIIDYKFYETFAYIIYGAIMLLLLAVIFIGATTNGATAWIKIGPLKIQPGEIAKFATALALAKYLNSPNKKVENFNTYSRALLIIGVPALIIILQNDTGSAMVFAALVVALYREGLPSTFMVLGLTAIILFIAGLFVPPATLGVYVGVMGLGSIIYSWLADRNIYQVFAGWGIVGSVMYGLYYYFDHTYISIGLFFVFAIIVIASFSNFRSFRWITFQGAYFAFALLFTISIDFVFNTVLQPHQRKRIEILINPESDPLGVGYQVTQSKIAIGSGGLLGKGFLEGTQTKLEFVPEQSTDFIFCTIGEEHGWLGAMFVFTVFFILIARIIMLAERQKSRFSRVYGYSVASILFFHFMINIGMTIGLFPVIGIPLPFVSYGGSSLWSFTILLFVFLKLDSQKNQMLGRA